MIAIFDRVISGKSLIVLAALVIAGFLGNYFSVHLFFGADFLFGSIFVFLVMYFYGLGWGMFAAVIVHSYTFFLWGHPYGFINFTSEALFIGLFLRKKSRNLLGLAGAFWLFVGIPLIWIEHDLIMNMGAVTTLFVMLKQAINGIFNALLTSLVICYLPLLKRYFTWLPVSKGLPLQASLCNLFVMMVLVPTLLLTMLEVKEEKVKLESGLMTELQSMSTNVQLHLRSWHQSHLQALQMLAYMAGESSMTPSKELQHKTEILKLSFPDFIATHIENTDGHAITFAPSVNEKGESTNGANLSDRNWFQDVKSPRPQNLWVDL